MPSPFELSVDHARRVMPSSSKIRSRINSSSGFFDDGLDDHLADAKLTPEIARDLCHRAGSKAHLSAKLK